MKKFIFIIFPLILIFLTSCVSKSSAELIDDEEENVINGSASDNLILYSNLKDELDEKALNVSTKNYYKTKFEYEVSYISGRTSYNIVSSKRICEIRNDSLYIKKTSSYNSSSIFSYNDETIYKLENDSIYSYKFEGNYQTFDENEILPVYSVIKEDDFKLNDIIGFSQAVVTSEGYDGTNGTIKKDDNIYTIEMSYSYVKNESLVKFIYNLGFFSNMLNYISEDDLIVEFVYEIFDTGYNLEYGFSYDTTDTTISAKVNLGMEEDSFDIFEFEEGINYLKKYPQNFDMVTDIYNENDIIKGKYADSSFIKFYLTKGLYGVLSNDDIVTSYLVFDIDGNPINKNKIILDKMIINTNYFEIEEDGYYYIYIGFDLNMTEFKLEKINYDAYSYSSNELEKTNIGNLDGMFNYKIYTLNIDTYSKIYIKNNDEFNELNLILPIMLYSNINIKPQDEINFNLRAGIYYLIVMPSSDLSYNFDIDIYAII